MANVALVAPAVQNAGAGYTVPGSQEIILRNISASINGASAAGNFVPAVQLVSPSGVVMGTFPIATTLAAGASADVSWFPGVTVQNSSGLGPAYQTVYDLTLTSPAATFDTTGTNIGGGNILEIWAYLRSDRVGVGAGSTSITFNNDSSAIYQYVWTRNEGGTADLQNVHNTTGINAQYPGTTNPTSVFAIIRMTIPNYQATVAFKTVEFTNGWSETTASTFDRAILGTGQYNSTNAITSIQIPGSPGNWIAGSRLLVLIR
jgi:hypothetical protein